MPGCSCFSRWVWRNRLAPGEWLVRRDFETVLKAMQRTSDRQKMLASHGALLSDERLPLVVLDMRKLKTLEGRVLAHGEEEAGKGAGRHYLLLEGTDAKVHLIYYTPEMEEARSRGKLRANSFVRLQKQFENGRPVLEIEDSGDAERVAAKQSPSRRKSQDVSGARNRPLRRWLGRMAGSLPSRGQEYGDGVGGNGCGSAPWCCPIESLSSARGLKGAPNRYPAISEMSSSSSILTVAALSNSCPEVLMGFCRRSTGSKLMETAPEMVTIREESRFPSSSCRGPPIGSSAETSTRASKFTRITPSPR